MNWSKYEKVLVTGGASFIGSHLVDKLLERGVPIVKVVDNLSSGRQENIQKYIDTGRVQFYNRDLLCPHVAPIMMHDVSMVFHLAADHGGRGYVDLHNAQCSTNLILDGIVIKAAKEAEVEKVIFASSGCVYPNYIQTDVTQELYLTEDLVGPPYDSDNLYGWAKLMAEMTLKAYYKQYGMKSVSLRYFTCYGPRGVENHAVMAMIARAFVKANPFEIWGNGKQLRNWTYIDDIVEGTILAAEKVDDARAINLGTMERISVMDAVKETLWYVKQLSQGEKFSFYLGYKPELKFLLDMPTGPLNRIAENSLAKELLGWEPKVKFVDGLRKTIDWYFSYKNKKEVQKILNKKLLTEKL